MTHLGWSYAFWVIGFAPAEQLWSIFFVASGAGFNFHNTYISNALEIGPNGLGLQVLCICGGAVSITLYALIRPTAANALLLSGPVATIVRRPLTALLARPATTETRAGLTERNASPADVRTPRYVARGSGAGQDIGPLSPILDSFAKSRF